MCISRTTLRLLHIAKGIAIDISPRIPPPRRTFNSVLTHVLSPDIQVVRKNNTVNSDYSGFLKGAVNE